MKPLWTDHAKLQKLRQAIDAVRVNIGHLASHKVSPNDDEDDNEPKDGGIGRIDCEIANLDTPTDTWQRLLTVSTQLQQHDGGLHSISLGS